MESGAGGNIEDREKENGKKIKDLVQTPKLPPKKLLLSAEPALKEAAAKAVREGGSRGGNANGKGDGTRHTKTTQAAAKYKERSVVLAVVHPSVSASSPTEFSQRPSFLLPTL